VTDLLRPTAENVARCAAILRDGGLVAFPTDTVYGVGISWTRRDRIEALFALKRRPPEKRIPVLVTGLLQAEEVGAHIDDRARRLVARWWPGALTLVLPTEDGDTIAVRAPDHAVALALIEAAGPLLASSANVSGEPDTLGGDEVLIAFATEQDDLAAVLDDGAVAGGSPSTVVDLSVTPARVLRPGPVSREALAEDVELD
jgi:L-threonylcarbamoyladenylate synthase